MTTLRQKAGSVALSGAFVLTALAAPATAMAAVDNSIDHPDSAWNATFKTHMHTGEALTTPTTNFEYTIVPGAAVGTNILPAPDNSATISNSVFDAATSVIDTQMATQTSTITIDETKFSDPGIYVYDVNAVENSEIGVKMDSDAQRSVYAFITSDAAGNLTCENIIMGQDILIDPTAGDPATKSDGYTVGYGVNNDGSVLPADDPEAPQTFTIHAKTTGAMGDRDLDFSFAPSNATTIAAGTQFNVVGANGDTVIKWDGTKFVKTDGSDYTFLLHDSQDFDIENMFPTTGLTVSTPGAANYTVYAANSATPVDPDAVGAVPSDTVTAVLETAGADVNHASFTFDYDMIVPPTGAMMQAAPYLAIALLAAGGSVFMLIGRRRKNEE